MLSLKIHVRKHQCSVRGCRNRTHTYLIHRSADHAGPIYICRDCLRELHAFMLAEDANKEDDAFFEDSVEGIGTLDAKMEGIDNPNVTEVEHSYNPTVTQTEPNVNPSETESEPSVMTDAAKEKAPAKRTAKRGR